MKSWESGKLYAEFVPNKYKISERLTKLAQIFVGEFAANSALLESPHITSHPVKWATKPEDIPYYHITRRRR